MGLRVVFAYTEQPDPGDSNVPPHTAFSEAETVSSFSRRMYRLLKQVYRGLFRGAIRALNAVGLNVTRIKDFYSPLPVQSELEETRHLWDRPSELVGVDYDLDAMRALLTRIVVSWSAELAEQPSHEEIKKLGYGPGFPVHDAQLVYCMMRELKPRRYIEIGSGLSTYYAWLAAAANKRDGSACAMTCVDPYPTGRLWSLDDLSAIERKVEEVDLALFDELGAGDVLFIDSTHVLKVGGDVAYLFLEVLPRLRPGVVFHVHDIHFPYNTPVPADEYIFGAKWPLYRTEAMILQAFLTYNSEFETVLSAPWLRHVDEEFLARTLPDYRAVETKDYDTHFGSYWGRRVN